MSSIHPPIGNYSSTTIRITIIVVGEFEAIIGILWPLAPMELSIVKWVIDK